MKKIILLLPFILVNYISANAQLFENFEVGDKGSYAAASVTLSSGDWVLNEALIGNLAADQKNGSRSLRMRNEGGFVTMEFDIPNAGLVSFYYGTYITDGNANRHSNFRLQKSENSGGNWINVGDELTSGADFVKAEFEVQSAVPVRFRILKTSGTVSGSNQFRLSIDDFTVTTYIEISEDPKIFVELNDVSLQNPDSAAYHFPVTLVNGNRVLNVKVANQGNQPLTFNAGTTAGSDSDFSISGNNSTSLNTLESATFQVVFSPSSAGHKSGNLLVESNDPDLPELTIALTGEGLSGDSPISIAQARELPFGTIVTVTGWVSVANEFEGPVYMQDNTAGIAVFHAPLHTAVERGDSIMVTGPISEFNPISGPQGTFLRQITGSDVTFTVFSNGSNNIEPKLITLQEMNSGCCESQLVLIENITFNDTGVFPTNSRNYIINQGSTTGEIRIDTRSNFSGATIPNEPVSVIGVVDRFNAIYQIKPRDLEDIGAEAYEIPFEDIPRNLTFDAVTWNIEWFGNASNGPSDGALQFQNVKKVIETIGADLYALQEIANNTLFSQLVDSLDGYGGFVANYSQTQRTAYLYKRATVDSLFTDYVAQSSSWASGRYPFMFLFNATSNGKIERVRAINFHAKAFATINDYNQRIADSQALKEYTDTRVSLDNLLILGDYNDDMTVSTYNNQVSPYQNFLDDNRYVGITKSLSLRGLTSYRSISNIDHIMVNNKMDEFHLDGAERIENVSYIGSYLSSTSDHYPVWTRFLFAPLTSSYDSYIEIPYSYNLDQNYPNPFNPSTRISFSLPSASHVSLNIYDVTGRLVGVVTNGILSGGEHKAYFDARGLASGVYMYRLVTDFGAITRKMMLVR